MVCRRRPPRVRAHRAGPQRGRHADGAERAGGRGGRVHAVELSHQPDRAQDRRGAGRGLRLSVQGAGGNARFARGAAELLCGCRRARGRGGPGLWQPGRNLQLPDSAPGGAQGDFHRLHRRGQAAGCAGRPAHEARDDGAGRARPRDRGGRRRRGAGSQGGGRRQVPQRRAGLHLAHALSGAQQHRGRVHPGLRRLHAKAQAGRWPG